MIFNSRDAVATLAVSGGGLIVGGGSTGSGSWSGIRSDIGPTSGKYYVEMAITGNSAAGGSNGSIAVGVMPTVVSLNNPLGIPSGQAYFPWSGLSENNGSAGSLQVVATASVTVDIALDIGNGKVWWRPNNGNWNNAVIGSQDPATNTGGMSFTPSALGVFLAATLSSSAVGLTVNFGTTAYTRTPPSGFGACPASGFNGNTMYWNAADARVGITSYDFALNGLSSIQTSGWSSMRSFPSFPVSGKWYWEITFLNTPSNQLIVGAMNASAVLSNFPGFSTNGVGIQSSGSTFYNNATGGVSGSAAVSGDVMGIAIDAPNAKMWSRLNASGWFNALIGAQNPANNTGGVPCAGVFGSGNIMAAVGMFSTNFAVLANFGQTAFANAAPSGFVGPFSSVPVLGSSSGFFFGAD